MTFLPIVERELRVRSRLKSTYRFRLFAAVAAILFVGVLMLVSEGMTAGGNVGQGMFLVLAWAAFIYCLMEGARNTADCLSEEKRAGTLGLLFLTDLKGYDVVLGKLMATSLNSFYGLLAIFPPLGIPLIMGGVTVGEFWRLVLVLIMTLLFSLSAGMFVSALSRDERRAWGGTALIVGAVTMGPPMFNALLPGPQILVGPALAFQAMFDAHYQAAPGWYWNTIGSLASLSAALLASASFILPRAWHDRPAGAGTRSRWAPRTPDEPRARALRQSLLDVNPVVWLAARGERQRFIVWTAVLVVSALGIVLWSMAAGSRPVAISILVIFLLLHLGLSMWVASEACSLFAGARESGSLDLLLGTPLSLREILDGFALGLKRLFFRPLMVLLAVEAVLLAGYLTVGAWRGTMTASEASFTVLGVGLYVGASIMDTFAVARYGMWAGLIARKPGTALGKTLGFVLIGPLLLWVWCILLWPVAGLVKNLIFISYAQDRLRKHFRFVVTERYGARADAAVVLAPRRRPESELPPVLPAR